MAAPRPVGEPYPRAVILSVSEGSSLTYFPLDRNADQRYMYSPAREGLVDTFKPFVQLGINLRVSPGQFFHASLEKRLAFFDAF